MIGQNKGRINDRFDKTNYFKLKPIIRDDENNNEHCDSTADCSNYHINYNLISGHLLSIQSVEE